jgi:hypothetical protein
VILWDGGNNDLPFFRPDLHLVVVDPLRAGHELRYHPGEANLRMADVVVVNKLDSASAYALERVLADAAAANPEATIVRAASPVTLDDGPPVAGRCVLCVEDGPTVTHGGMPFGAATLAARQEGARLRVDPRATAVGSIAEVYEDYPHIGAVLPAMGYGDEQLAELEATINATDCDVVLTGTPIDLGRLIDSRHPIRHVRYELEEIGQPTIADVLAPIAGREPMTASAAERRRVRNGALVAMHPRWHGVRHPELIALPPRRFSQLDMLPAVERGRLRRSATEDAYARRAERSRAIVAAHPRWHGILHPERIVFPESPPEAVALLAYRGSVRRACRHLRESQELYDRVAAIADGIDRRSWPWAASPVERASRPAPPSGPSRFRRPQLPRVRIPKRSGHGGRLRTGHLLPH